MTHSKKNTIIVIAGPTAIGKTALAIELAKKLSTQIISADSRQCYKELNIGVAKPSEHELNAVHHYFISSHSIHQEVNAGVFEQYTLQAADEIFKHNQLAVMVGGTGLYIKIFCEGIDTMPATDILIRNEINTEYEKYGLSWLQDEVKNSIPDFWLTAEQQNPQRLMRALEIFYQTGKSISSFKKKKSVERDFNIVKIGLELDRKTLYERINNRVDVMMKDGLLDEVKGLLQYRALNALQTVGYSELFDYFDEKISLNEAVEKIKQHTRNYAKRQITWFKKDEGINWLNASDENLLEDILSLLKLHSKS